MCMDSSVFPDTQQILWHRIGVMSLGSMELAGLWGSPWGGRSTGAWKLSVLG